jgi:uncharacterized phiE125 gp8 family phage protein
MTSKPFPYLILNTPATSEPLSLSEVKQYLRIDGTADDKLLVSLLAAARASAEKYLKRSLITQTWLLTYDGYAPSETLLPKGPVQSITSVKLIARDTTETIVSSSTYYLNAGKEKLIFDAPPIGHIVEILYVTGYGTASAVPDEIKQGMLAHISDLYDKRSESVALPESTRNLYSVHRLVRL